mmetsp:Transcript_33217/g.72458  ORF Transcript_33217/g.72458 Transcript_33217/m.72458 type:complete len:203 (+) Transcript_33217:459-1067(+)
MRLRQQGLRGRVILGPSDLEHLVVEAHSVHPQGRPGLLGGPKLEEGVPLVRLHLAVDDGGAAGHGGDASLEEVRVEMLLELRGGGQPGHVAHVQAARRPVQLAQVHRRGPASRELQAPLLLHTQHLHGVQCVYWSFCRCWVDCLDGLACLVCLARLACLLTQLVGYLVERHSKGGDSGSGCRRAATIHACGNRSCVHQPFVP